MKIIAKPFKPINYQELKSKIKNLEDIFQQYEEIGCVYLFGSYIQGRATQQSDLDFAILVRDQKLSQDKVLLAYKIEKALGFIAPVEVMVLNLQKLLFKFSVIKNGKIIYERDRDFRVKFEVEVLKEFLELEPHLNLMEKFRLGGLLRRLGYETA